MQTATGKTEGFKVELRECGGAWREAAVEPLVVGAGLPQVPFPRELLRRFGGIGTGARMARASLCEFFWKEPVEVRVTAPGLGCGTPCAPSVPAPW